jgi:hypothetical protein
VALYKYPQNITQSDGAAFDADFGPGTVMANSGIYRCKNCGDEIAANKNQPLPPQNHHQHANGLPIRWQLLVFAQTKG